METKTAVAEDAFTRFENMSREDLLQAKAGVDSKLRRARNDLSCAQRRPHAVAPHEFDGLEERVARLSSASQRIQTELTLRASRRKEDGARRNALIVDEVRRTIAPELFRAIVARVEADY